VPAACKSVVALPWQAGPFSPLGYARDKLGVDVDGMVAVVFVMAFILSFGIFKTALRERDIVALLAGYSGMILSLVLEVMLLGMRMGWWR
jgi:hypothetical protein